MKNDSTCFSAIYEDHILTDSCECHIFFEISINQLCLAKSFVIFNIL